jgi:titin
MRRMIFLVVCLSTGCSGGGDSSGDGRSSVSAVSEASGGQLRLSWGTGTGSISGYYLEQSTDGVIFAQVASVSGTSVVLSNLARGTRYYFRVRAFNAGGTSPYSSVVSAVP